MISAVVVGYIVKDWGNRPSGYSLKDPDERVCTNSEIPSSRSYDGKFHCERCGRHFN